MLVVKVKQIKSHVFSDEAPIFDAGSANDKEIISIYTMG
ncbi:hypothetical protein ambt_11495 [Alteromonas naphthalenivorans]|jgi:hypothetical protein|uniref:Uncharacterized protein n=1 Tax=Alteromonas naphthalenivorans TaxID=715451 RepID=F5ZD58_ALTNA|nr:hypothetical protein ambt_11495 [Alteromonas naphthalenivorans]